MSNTPVLRVAVCILMLQLVPTMAQARENIPAELMRADPDGNRYAICTHLYKLSPLVNLAGNKISNT